MNTIKIYFTFLVLYTQSAFAIEPAFEAYSKFILGGQHSGYIVQRFVIDDKSKTMTSTYYTYVKTPTGTTIESLVAKADMNFEPVSYQYSVLVDGVTKSVDAHFKNKKMTGVMTMGKQKMNVTLTVPQSGFLSTFLNYVILKNGLAPGKNYSFNALAEEAPGCFPSDKTCNPKMAGFLKGTVLVKNEEKFKGLDAYKLDMNFKGIDFSGYINSKGETLGSISPLQNAGTEIVATKNEAVGSFPFNEKHIKAIFNNIPEGKKNSLYATPEKPTAPAYKPATAPSAITTSPAPVPAPKPGP